MPLVSIIIPTHNRARLVTEAIQSVLDQTHRQVEVVVIDDACTDETPRVIAETFRKEIDGGRLAYLRNETHQERSASRNRGMAATRGEYIAFLDDDDLFLPDHLEKCLRRLRNRGAVAIGAGVFVTDLDRNPLRAYSFPFRGRLTPNELALLGLGITCCNAILRRDAVERAGGFREGMHQGEDIDFFQRVAMTGKICLLKKRTVLRRIHESHYTSDRRAMNHVRFQDGLQMMLVENSRRLNYPLSKRLLGYLHLFMAWTGLGEGKRRYAFERLKEALRSYPALAVIEPYTFRVAGRMLLLANLRLYEFLRKARHPWKRPASASS